MIFVITTRFIDIVLVVTRQPTQLRRSGDKKGVVDIFTVIDIVLDVEVYVVVAVVRPFDITRRTGGEFR